MAPKAKGELPKGQRPISSFFFKKPTDRATPGALARASAPAPPRSRAHQPSSSRLEDGSLVEQQAPTSGPPQKRQRAEDSSSLRDHHAQVAYAEAEPMDLTGDANGHDLPAAEAGRCAPACMHPAAAAERHQQQAGLSGRTAAGVLPADERHERWQSKLVHGTPASRRGATAADIVPKKHTPLEEQVYALKRKHPGVLLIIEVCMSGPYSSHPLLAHLLFETHKVTPVWDTPPPQ